MKTGAFYQALPRVERFEDLVAVENYARLPDDWSIAACDVVNSTDAIAGGHYKKVNMAGASVISALSNAIGQQQVPFVFGGDGAIAAIGSDHHVRASDALAAAIRWVEEDLGLEMRAAIVPVADIRACGRDVRIARYAPGKDVSYAMFTGGGAAWAEARMKAGQYLIEPAAPGSRPDLSGLSCRWEPMATANGVILSLIAVPARQDSHGFAELASRIIELAKADGRNSHPVPPGGPPLKWLPAGLELEVRAAAPLDKRITAKWRLRAHALFSRFLFATGMRVGRFEPQHYIDTLVRHSDFRKVDDGLKMTLDCAETTAALIETTLEEGLRAGICHYGLHRQEQALVTCIVPSPMSDDHVHFIDGATGGYAMAAAMLKRQLAT